MKPALVIFAYNRPVHLAALLQSIGKESLQEVASIYFYIDGPRNLETDAKLVDACADIAERFVTADVPKIINLASTNKGLRSSVIAGVSEVLSSNESCIVLEDDLILHSDSLFFLKWALASYRLDERVGSVSAYNPCEYHEGRKPAILTPRHSSWAWGTWAFIWDGFISTNLGTPSRSSERYWRRYYNLAGETLVDMYKLQRNGKIDSWSIDFDFYNWSTLRWSVCPNHNLVINRGFDDNTNTIAR